MAPADRFKYDAFISYRRSDGAAVARWLRQRLLQYRPPQPLSKDYSANLRVYLDTIYERATDDFFENNIKPSLAESKHLILVCTPSAFTRRPDGGPSWVERELEYFMSLPQGRSIIPVLAGTEKSIPPMVRDAHANIEVIDLRLRSRTSWLFPRRTQYLNDEILKIIIALLNVPGDLMPAFRREEALRRQARARLFAAVGAVLLSLVTTLAIWAMVSLAEVSRQLVQNHTLQGQELVDEDPLAAGLHFAAAAKIADSFLLRKVGINVDAGLARLWLGQYKRRDPPTLFWHDASVTAAALSLDGSRLATGTMKGTVAVWNVRTGQQIGKPVIHGGQIEHLAFSRDGGLLVSAGRNNRALVWQVSSGTPIGEPIVHDDYVMSADFDPSGARLATVGADGSVRITELASRTRIDLRSAPGSSMHRVEFSLDGRRIVTSSSDGTAQLWDAWSGTPINSPMVQGNSYFTSFSRDGRFVLTSGSPRVWDAETGGPIGPPVQQDGAILAQFSPAADRIAIASWDKSVRIWDRQNAKQIGKSMLHSSPVRLVAWDSSGRLVATVDSHSTVRVWNAEHGELLETLFRHDQDVSFVAFAPDDTLVTASWDGTARITHTTGIDKNPWNVPQAAVATFNRSGTVLVTGSSEGTVTLFDVPRQRAFHDALVQDAGISNLSLSLDGGHILTISENVSSLERSWSGRLWTTKTRTSIGPIKPGQGISDGHFSSDSRLVLLQGRDAVYLVDVDSGNVRDGHLKHPAVVSHAAFVGDGRMIATTSQDGALRLWNEDGKLQGELHKFGSSALYVSSSRTGRYLAIATGAYDSAGWVWDLKEGRLAGPALRHTGNVHSIKFDRAERRVVTASDDGKAQVWDPFTGARVGRPLQHGKSVSYAEFSPDGRLVVTASRDGRARVWSSETGEPAGQFLEHGPRPVEQVFDYSIGVKRAEFSPTGEQILTTSEDGTVRLWEFKSSDESWELLTLRREVETISTLDDQSGVMRRLTQDEWKRRRDKLTALSAGGQRPSTPEISNPPK